MSRERYNHGEGQENAPASATPQKRWPGFRRKSGPKSLLEKLRKGPHRMLQERGAAVDMRIRTDDLLRRGRKRS